MIIKDDRYRDYEKSMMIIITIIISGSIIIVVNMKLMIMIIRILNPMIVKWITNKNNDITLYNRYYYDPLLLNYHPVCLITK